MVNQLEKLRQVGELMMAHGLELIQGLLVVIIGLMTVRWLVGALRKFLGRFIPNRKWTATFTSVAAVVLVVVVVVAASVQAGLPIRPILRVLVVGVLVATGAIVLCRPLLPDLPFRVGNTIKVGDVLGKVDGITFLNTRIRTFDGKTIFIPNQKVFDNIVSNYHFTPTRRIKINLGIRYDSDLIRAKQIMEELMIEDPRVELTPRAVVYVLSLTKDCVQLGARCWVPNLKYWVTKCDLLEKIKLTFDREGIRIAHAQFDIYHHGEGDAPDLGSSEAEEWS
ncbi:MAG: mechanosensitive ion channel family protein [Deferrisomatales bacterium]|nr:mechanosensitive ion channel family protein [Deferrisomatales bacterium]